MTVPEPFELMTKKRADQKSNLSNKSHMFNKDKSSSLGAAMPSANIDEQRVSDPNLQPMV